MPANLDQPRDVSRRRALLWLLVITCLGGFLRCRALDRPPVWGDEAMVFVRTCGTYEEMKTWLRSDGFTPMQYQTIWWVRQGLPVPVPTGGMTWEPMWSPGGEEPWLQWSLPRPTFDAAALTEPVIITPTVLRLPSAITGTLMIPAMYLLAVGLARRRTALLAALLTACSAFLLTYSRDAKMYMPAWCFATLHLGLLLLWLRRRHERRWATPALLGWTFFGVAMVAWHANVSAVLGISLLIGLTYERPAFLKRNWSVRRHRLPTIVPLFIGLGVIGIALAGYYGVGEPDDDYHVRGFNRWSPLHGETPGNDQRQMQRGGLGWVGYQNRGRGFWEHLRYTATAFAFNWEWPKPDDEPRIEPSTRFWLKFAATSLAIVFFLLIPVAVIIKARRTGLDGGGTRWLWLATWLLVPPAVWWARSMNDPLLSIGLPDDQTVAGWSVPGLAVVAVFVAIVGLIASGVQWRQPRVMAVAAWQRCWPIALAGGLACLAAKIATAEGEATGSIWVPRYLGWMMPAVILVAAGALSSVAWWWLRWPCLLLVLGINLANAIARTEVPTEPPADQWAADIALDERDPSVLAFVQPIERTPANAANWGAPGGAYLMSFPSIYYGLLETGRTDDRNLAHPLHLNFLMFRRVANEIYDGHLINERSDDSRIARSLTTVLARPENAQVTTVILWTVEDELPEPEDPSDPRTDPIAGALDGWYLAGERWVPVREHWTWQHFSPTRRRVYEKIE